MGDFLLDLRPHPHRCSDPELVRLIPEFSPYSLTDAAHDIHIAASRRSALWQPFDDGRLRVTLAGIVALDEDEWASVEIDPRPGGLAAKAIARRYLASPAAWQPPEGGYVIHVLDRTQQTLHVVTDPCGLMPCYETTTSQGLLLSSHPDILARAAGVRRLDTVSLGEFLATGRVSSPHSYYEDIKAVSPATVASYALAPGTPKRVSQRSYFSWEPASDPLPDALMAERIVSALRSSTRRCSNPRYGPTGVALSGGLDSRTVLSLMGSRAHTVAFSVYDRENIEVRTARAIAHASGIAFHALHRSADFYGENAKDGVMLSGGMGDLASNHFLGLRRSLVDIGAAHVLTGCYFDYMFKSLPLNTAESAVTRRQRIAPFSMEHYLPWFRLPSATGRAVEERLHAVYPDSVRSSGSNEDLQIRRMLPLYQEGDNQQRLPMLRAHSWLSPAVDRQVLGLALSLSPEQRINVRVFLRSVMLACPPQISRITNTNTLTRPSSSRVATVMMRYVIAIRRAYERRLGSTTSAESWPTWERYLSRSPALQEAWSGSDARIRSLLQEVTGSALPDRLTATTPRAAKWMLRLLTLVYWLSHGRAPQAWR